jgi:hypothetical protein
MMGRLNRDQEQLFYSFSLDDAVPDDHPVRGIAAALAIRGTQSAAEYCSRRNQTYALEFFGVSEKL